MGMLDILLLAVIAGCVAAAVITIRRKPRGCGGQCAGCPHQCARRMEK